MNASMIPKCATAASAQSAVSASSPGPRQRAVDDLVEAPVVLDKVNTAANAQDHPPVSAGGPIVVRYCCLLLPRAGDHHCCVTETMALHALGEYPEPLKATCSVVACVPSQEAWICQE